MSKSQIIGCIHLPALPGSPGYAFNNREILDKALAETTVYLESGVQGLIVENTADIPYLKGAVYPETVSLLSIICYEIRKIFPHYLGLQVLAGANAEALAIAYNAGLDFIRAEGFSFAHVADEGIIQSCAADLLRKRANLGAKKVKVVADIKKKHSSHALTSDLSLADMAELTQYMEPDGIVITGFTTGQSPTVEEVRGVKEKVSVPVYIGSGINPANAADFSKVADYLIVGSYFKKNGHWESELDKGRIQEILDAVQ